MDALTTLGVADAVAEAGFATPRMVLRSGTGKELVTLSRGRSAGRRARGRRRSDGPTCTGSSATRRSGAASRSPTDGGWPRSSPRPATACAPRFSDGSTATADVLVGADGLRSRVRTLIDPTAPPARYTGLLNVGGYARGLDLGRPPGVMNFCFGRRCFLGYVTSPGRRRLVVHQPAQRASRTATAPGRSDAAWRDAAARALRATTTCRWPICWTPRTSGFAGWPTYDIPTVPRWHRDGMVLVGDAVHAASPASGQGASMAFEDAVTLARCLRDRPSAAEAFAAYERLRRAARRGGRRSAASAPATPRRRVRSAAGCATGWSCRSSRPTWRARRPHPMRG